MQTKHSAGPLAGLKVLELGQLIAGPFAAKMLADFGADVVKIEPPGGDWCRQLGRQYGDMSAFFAVYNRGKRSVAIDMKDRSARAAVRQMALEADVVVEAFRPGVMARFGLDYASLAPDNPRLLYLSVNGFGSTGPLVDAPATDVILQAFSGHMYMNRDENGQPARVDHVMIDVLTGLYGFQALSAALLDLARHGGPGRHIECSMLKSAVAFQAGKIVEDVLEGGKLPMYVPLGVFRAADGSISISVRRDDHFLALCKALGREDLSSSGLYATGAMRVERRDALLPEIRAEFGKRTVGELSALLTSAGILNSPVNDYAALAAHEQTRVSGALQWNEQDGITQALPMADVPGTPPGSMGGQAPHIGQQTQAALRDWGVAPEVLQDLLARGAIRPDAPELPAR